MGVVERFGTWAVTWRPKGFSIHGPAKKSRSSFAFKGIVLPVEVCVPGGESGHAVLKRDPSARIEVLQGASRADLLRFKRRMSGEVLAAVRTSRFGCSDCASEAGMIATQWSGAACPGCRESYCRGPKCLRRLKVTVVRHGSRVCKHCGTANGPVTPD